MSDRDALSPPEFAPLRYEFVRFPRCPNCEDIYHKMLRSIDQGDGTRKQRRECKGCGWRFDCIWE